MEAQVFVKPKDKTLVGTPKMNLLAELIRNHTNYNKVVKQEGFDINPVGWLWEWTINIKGSKSFLVLQEQEKELYAYFYLKGSEVLTQPSFVIPVDSIGEYEADSFMELLKGIQVRTMSRVSNNPKATNYTKPKNRKKRK